MKICNHCGAVLEDYALFCNNCGMSTKDVSSSINEAPVSTHENPFEVQPMQQNFAVEDTGYIPQAHQPNYNPYTYNQIPQPKAPRIPTKERVQGIIGMILSLVSAIWNAELLLLIVFFCFIGIIEESSGDLVLISILFTMYEVIFTAPAVVGLAFGTTAKRNGNYSKLPIAAKVLGLTSIFTMVFSLIIPFLCIVAMAQ